MPDDKQRQVQAARDALMEPDGITITEDAFRVGPLTIDATEAEKHIIRFDTGPMQLVATGEMAELIREAIEALIAWHVTSGVDKGDRLRNVGRQLWLMREKSRPPA